jgi:hypothetical protein
MITHADRKENKNAIKIVKIRFTDFIILEISLRHTTVLEQATTFPHPIQLQIFIQAINNLHTVLE